jgi:M6 family metalloprotease-like protein
MGSAPRDRRRLVAVALAAAAVLVVAVPSALAAGGPAPPLVPIDPQDFELPQDQTWDDYRAVPGTNWSDPSLVPTVKKWKTAFVVVDFPDTPFVISQPPMSHIFGNPQPTANSIPRESVPQFYEDFYNTPSLLNHGQTMNSYWMEDSLGRYGVSVDAFGPYGMVGNRWEYFLRDAGNAGSVCPTGFTCTRNVRTEARAAWIAQVGEDVAATYDNIFYVIAGHDESSTWQEFGEMMFQTMDDVTEPFGNPDPTKPNWAPTRYIPWSSFAAAAGVWPSASGNSSTEGESSGMGTYAHELSHNLGIGDNYNNPYGIPLRRSYTGPWDMLSRGSFNGPGGPHKRYFIPSTEGGSLGSNHNVRNRLELGFLPEENLLRLDRNQLDESGPVVVELTARAAYPGPSGFTGVNIALSPSPDLADPARGDQSPTCVVADNPDCPGPTRTGSGAISQSSLYNNYTLEVVQRIGNDSFAPGHGVLVSRTKNADSAPFVWIIDAHPEDMNIVDFNRPNGEPSMMSFGDYRQLADATFNAGLKSGTQYEYVDAPNRLHFYVIDVEEDANGVLTYTVGIRSLNGSGPQARGVALGNGRMHKVRAPWAANCVLPLTNTGTNAPPAGTHPEDVSAQTDGDIYRITASIEGDKWDAELYNALATVEFGKTVDVPVYVTREWRSSQRSVLTVTATSESDPTKTATATCNIKVANMDDK